MRSPSFWVSLVFACAGLKHLLRTQRNFRVQCVMAALTGGLCCWLKVPWAEAAVLALTVGVVLAFEALNTALETIVDLASPGYHDLARIAKDVAAAAVLITALTAVLVGAFVLGPPLWQWAAGFWDETAPGSPLPAT